MRNFGLARKGSDDGGGGLARAVGIHSANAMTKQRPFVSTLPVSKEDKTSLLCISIRASNLHAFLNDDIKPLSLSSQVKAPIATISKPKALFSGIRPTKLNSQKVAYSHPYANLLSSQQHISIP